MATLVSRITDLAGRIRDKFNEINPRLTPPGGAQGHVLGKTSATDHDTAWVERVDMTTTQSIGGQKTFTTGADVLTPGTIEVKVGSSGSSGVDAKLTLQGARTNSSTAEIAALNFRNSTSGAYDLARIVAKDPDGSHVSGNGRLIFQVSDGGVLADQGYIDHTGAVTFYQSLTVQGSVVWHGNNDGHESGMDADLLDGNHATAFAFLTGATFTGGVEAPTFDGDGSLVTGVDADFLDGFDSTSFVRADAVASQTVNVGLGDFIVSQNSGGPANVIWWDSSAATLYLGTTGSGGGVIVPRVPISGTQPLTAGAITGTSFSGPGAGITGVLKTTGVGSQTISVQDTVANANQSGIVLDMTMSGADALTADRNHRGLLIDVDSSATGGDLTEEHRVYGAEIETTVTGDSDQVYGVYIRATAAHGAGTVTNLRGMQNVAQPDMAGGDVTTAYGTDSLVVLDAVGGALANGYGAWNRVTVTANYADNLNLGVGVRGEIEMNAAGTINNAYAVQAVIDTNAGTITNAYLFFGDYQGALPSNAWGIYINEPVPNLLAGGLQLGDDLLLDFDSPRIVMTDSGGTNEGRLVVDDGQMRFEVDPLGNTAESALRFLVDNAEKANVNEHGLGVGGATADATNGFSFSGTNALFNSDSDINLVFNKNDTSDDGSITLQSNFTTKALIGLLANDDLTIKVGASLTTALTIDEATGEVDLPATPHLRQFTESVAGSWLLDPNEHTGWGTRGPVDEAVAQDLGNVGADYVRTSGGFMYPFDVKILGFRAKHRNSNVAVEAWGWRFGYHTWTGGSNTVVTTNLLEEVADNAGVGPRDYNNTTNQDTDFDWSSNGWVMPAGAIFTVGVEAPTAVTTNYYVDIMAGYLLLERV